MNETPTKENFDIPQDAIPSGRLEAFERWYGLDAPSNIDHDQAKTAFFAGWHGRNLADTTALFGFLNKNFETGKFEWDFEWMPIESLVQGSENLQRKIYRSVYCCVTTKNGLFIVCKNIYGYEFNSLGDAFNNMPMLCQVNT